MPLAWPKSGLFWHFDVALVRGRTESPLVNALPSRKVRRPGEFWRKSPDNLEIVCYPSKLALDLWEHVLVIGVSRCRAGYATRLGSHRHGYLLHIVRKGELVHVVGEKPFRVRAGAACLLDYSRPLQIRNETEEAAEVASLLFDGRNLARIFAELDASRDPVFDGVDSAHLNQHFRELWRGASRKPPAFEARAHATLNAMLAELLASRARPSPVMSLVPRRAKLSEKVRLAVLRFERMYHTGLNLKETAAILGKDVSHFSRRFHTEVGMPPIQYLNRYRIEQAKRLLTTSQKPIHQIAPLVGISDPDYFARLFRRITGNTPRAWRRRTS